MVDSTTLAVLHGVRLGSVVGSDAVAARTGLDLEVVVRTVELVERRGLVRHHEGRLAGWSLTRAGREEVERLLGEELDSLGARSELEAVYREFLPLNTTVLEVCTDWQIRRDGGVEVPNDHDDPAHDDSVLVRLRSTHHRAQPLLRRLGAAVARFAGYEPRLDGALGRVLDGATEWLTRPTIDSYHTVWFELHEDLLATLGRQRADEHPGSASVDPPSTPAAPGAGTPLEEHA